MNATATAVSPPWWRAPRYREDSWREEDAALVSYFLLALVFSCAVYAFETYLDWRQHCKLREPQFPPRLADAIAGLGDYSAKTKKKDEKEEKEKEEEEEEEEETANRADDTTDRADARPAPTSLLAATLAKFDKSRAYGLDKSAFAFVAGAYTQLEGVIFLLLGYLPFMWTLSARALAALGLDGEHEIYRTLMLLTLTTLRETLCGLPFSLYATFVIEARHGFNKQTLSLFLTDKLKAFLLFVAIGYPVVAALIVVIRWGGAHFYLYVWGFLLAFSLVMVTIYPVMIMPLFNKFTPLEQGELRARIEALASSLSFPLTKLFVCDGSKRSSHSNAYFFGFFKSKRIVLFDTLLEQATDDEIVAVLGHELGHWKLWHTAQGFVIQQLYTFALFYVFGRCMHDAPLFASFGFAVDGGGDDAATKQQLPVVIGFLLFSSTVWAPVDHVLSFLVTLHTRRNEFQADAFAVDLGHARALQSGLTKLAIENLSNINPDPLYSAYHYSHPPLLERLNAVADREKKRQ